MEIATLAGGCFWCTEAIFQQLKGVKSVTPGYTGGTVKNPTYDQVCSGKTGHVEAIQIEFDPNLVPFEKLLEVFFATHNPTTLNQQGADVGTQYASMVFYHNDKQREVTENYIRKIQENYQDSIVTKLKPFDKFYKAENYHVDYYNTHSDALYCQVVIDPKIQKLNSQFGDQIKKL